MNHIIRIALLIINLFLSVYVSGQTEITGLKNKDFPIIIDSIPFVSTNSYKKNVPYEKAFEAFNKNNFEKAIGYYNSYIETDPFQNATFFNRGLCFYRMHDVKHACADFKYAAYLGGYSAFANYKSYCDSNIDLFSLLQPGWIIDKLPRTGEINNDSLANNPEFPGGIDSLYLFILHNLTHEFKNYLFTVKHNRVLLNITIKEDGSLSNPSITNDYDVDKFVQKEIFQVFASMPKWKPATRNGKPIKCNYLFPIIYDDAFMRVRNIIFDKGTSLLNENKLSESISYFDTIIGFNKWDNEAFYNRGICYYKMNDLKNACIDWVKSYNISSTTKVISTVNKFCDSTIVNDSKKEEPSNLIFTVTEEMPQFQGGDQMLFEYLAKSVKYPGFAREKGISGRVYVTFVIDRDGNVRDAKVLRGIGGGCDEEALRVVIAMPKWKPGKQNGRVVNVQYNLPVSFNMR